MERKYGQKTTLEIPDQSYYVESQGLVTFKPWIVAGEMQALYCQIADWTELSLEQIYYVYTAAKQCNHLSGEFWECGTYRGGSAALIAWLSTVPRKVRLFDTFAGMPEDRITPEFDLISSRYADTSVDTVTAALADVGAAVSIHGEKLPEGFAGLERSSIAFLHCDLSLYRSTLDCLEFCYSLMVKNGIMLIEGYAMPETSGVRSAVDEFFAGKSEFPIALTPGAAMVIKL